MGGTHLSKLVYLDTLGDNRAGGGEGVAAHEVHGRGSVEKPRLVGEALYHMPGYDGADDDRDDGGVAEAEVADEGDEDALAHQVNCADDAPVVTVLHQAPIVPGAHVCIPNNMLAEEGQVDGKHDRCVGQKVEPLVVRPLLEAGH
jgi:hypothetical protein